MSTPTVGSSTAGVGSGATATTTAIDSALRRFEPVGLDELVATADLQTRKDRKYLVPMAEVAPLLSELDRARVLTIDGDHRFAYRSTYFDTPRLDSYLDAARRRPWRYKVRTRTYVDSDQCMLEVKTRDRRGRTVKHRVPCDPAEEERLSDSGEAFVAAIEQTAGAARNLHPSLTTSFDRTTLLVEGARAEPARVTIDTDLIWRTPSGRTESLGPLALIETKTSGRPCAFDRILWRAGHRPAKVSKYGTGLAAINPRLPANKWNRVLTRHLDRPAEHPTIGQRSQSRA